MNGAAECAVFEKVRPHVHHCAHQQPAGATALDHQPVFGSPLLPDEILGAIDEIEEGILFLHEIPFSRHFSPILSPPRMCAMAYAMPRPSRLARSLRSQQEHPAAGGYAVGHTQRKS
jgi:hypothetical protein